MFKNILNGIKADRLTKPSRRPGIQVLFGSSCALSSGEGEMAWARLGVSGEKRTPSTREGGSRQPGPWEQRDSSGTTWAELGDTVQREAGTTQDEGGEKGQGEPPCVDSAKDGRSHLCRGASWQQTN